MTVIEETIKGVLLSLKISSKTDAEYIDGIEEIKRMINDESPLKTQPVNRVRWVPIDKVSPNDYNPNSVAKIEMGLLYTSI